MLTNWHCFIDMGFAILYSFLGACCACNCQLKYKKTPSFVASLAYPSPLCVSLFRILMNLYVRAFFSLFLPSSATLVTPVQHTAWHPLINKFTTNHGCDGIFWSFLFQRFSILRGMEIACTPQLGGVGRI